MNFKLPLYLLIAVVGFVVVVLLMPTFLEQNGEPVTLSPETAAFTEKIQEHVIETIGQPIEGFNAQIYLHAFPGLTEADFDGVQTREGEYVYQNGELSFARTKSRPITSAEEQIQDAGHATLYQNLRERFGDRAPDEIMETLIAE